MPLKIAVPNKGRLAEEALDALRSIGLRVGHAQDRTLVSNINGGRYQVLFTRAQDIPEFVEFGAADLGITGLDLVHETGARVVKAHDFPFGTCRLVLAAPETAKITSVEDVPADSRIATSFPNLTRRFFKKRRKRVRIVPISGASEIAPAIGVADLIADLTATGATLKQNHLTLVDVILDSWAVLIASPASFKARHGEIDDLLHALTGVQAASRKRYLMANVEKKRVAEVTRIVPGLSGPTIVELAVPGMVAVHAVVDEDEINNVVPKLKRAGATGILVLPIERLIP
ncbi:MAG: ATP phosphoribosyltransferase [Planctomycetes bacterium]|nr:ATP phosphoribosyltransferase [Planctomycetota bacterium]